VVVDMGQSFLRSSGGDYRHRIGARAVLIPASAPKFSTCCWRGGD
jgi:hypothetical protein